MAERFFAANALSRHPLEHLIKQIRGHLDILFFIGRRSRENIDEFASGDVVNLMNQIYLLIIDLLRHSFESLLAR